MKLESRYFWIVLTLVGDSTTTSDFVDPDDFAEADGLGGAGTFACAGAFFTTTLAFM